MLFRISANNTVSVVPFTYSYIKAEYNATLVEIIFHSRAAMSTTECWFWEQVLTLFVLAEFISQRAKCFTEFVEVITFRAVSLLFILLGSLDIKRRLSAGNSIYKWSVGNVGCSNAITPCCFQGSVYLHDRNMNIRRRQSREHCGVCAELDSQTASRMGK